MGVPLEALGVENSNLIIFDSNDKNHFRKIDKKELVSVSNFEPVPNSGSDFDL